jgi:hypothetical protein
MSMTPEERFWAKVRKSEGCWEWAGSRWGSRRQYGCFNVGGNAASAHRVAWELANGPIPEGKVVCHTCDFGLCVRPDHLFIGTMAMNSSDMVRKGRQGPRRRALREDQLPEVRRLRGSGLSLRAVGRALGVSYMTIRDIERGKSWGREGYSSVTLSVTPSDDEPQ